MSCDLTDPAIQEAYQEIVSGAPTNWFILGYHDTRDKISLYSKGTGGLEELKTNLSEEVLYAFLRVEDKYALLTYVSEQVSGLRRARALVHGKAVSALCKQPHVQINSSTVAELSDENIRTRMGLNEGAGGSPPTPEASNSPAAPSSPAVDPAPTTPPPAPAAEPRPVTPTSPTYDDNAAQNANNMNSAVSGMVSPARSASPLSTPRTERQMEIEAAERKVREETERQKTAEIAKRQRETQEREAREREMQAQKQATEQERRQKEESDKVAREAMKKQLMEMERLRGAGLSGYITIQGSGSPYWKRRFYVMRGQNIAFFRDENDRQPLSEMKLGGRVVNIEDASLDCLIPHSFRVDLYMGESHLFFSDNAKDKELAIAGFMKCNESA
ncbi:MAG: hypothetical protein J3Q66DRAFT_326408 [Benniella sp.]|nr:MAG: hypothetical protein J3Q66DRAFT_326408 [Benniella sp.]